MSATQRFAPEVPDLSALGARGFEDFLGGCRALVESGTREMRRDPALVGRIVA